ncbi:conserved exported hypothetical protein [Cupriavidus taiwanensis]|nr:tripartite tricarboxylate transporter substrate-binding protein [Cupriavidus taiwanensis]SOY61673.1 conserved exported hypothetical protein [Cupriavidus taiwanensis]SOY63108.1 conserved exported hypothetical protein [Cupriavidus taiwanensis]SOY98166.1 conserved exported hypothetical protein [Cupriavidus taiwanensis]SOZ77225.1 conserved exported hypothetical protein [Cupriavidus taiwanensis]SOZ85234.1 conserved exported hypothetical protein [Cupriavidus taiwanensis]
MMFRTIAVRAVGVLCLVTVSVASAMDTAKIMVPGSPGGGYDQTARTLGKALQESGQAKGATYENKPGAGGTLGLAQFVNSSKSDPNAICIMGAIMVTGVVQNNPPITLANATPIAKLFTEYNVIAVNKASQFRNLADLMAAFKKDPASVKWGGGSKGSTDHIGVAELARTIGVPSNKINYIPFGGGGEGTAAMLGGHISVITGGYSELAKYIESGQMRALAVTSPERLAGVQTPTLKEQRVNVVIGNWRGVYGAPGLKPEQQKALADAVVAATKTKIWQDTVKANQWTAEVITGEAFGKFVESEHARLRTILADVGLK